MATMNDERWAQLKAVHKLSSARSQERDDGTFAIYGVCKETGVERLCGVGPEEIDAFTDAMMNVPREPYKP